MNNSEVTPGSERRNLFFNLFMFALTGLVFLIYSCTFISHILAGLASSLTDELLWLALVCSSGFYGIALNQSYKAYVRTHGPSFSIGPFTILSTSILPSSSTFVVPPTPVPSSPMSYSNSTNATYYAGSGFSPRMDTPGMMYDQTPRQSFDATVCPPTPDSVDSHQTPRLVTPHMTHPIYNNNNNKSTDGYAYDCDTTPSKMSSKIGRYRLGGTGMGNKPAYGDVEKAPEMFGLGMGEIGGEEVQGVRP